MSNELAVVKKQSLVQKMADRFGVDADKMMSTLKETAFKVKDKQVTNEQMMALLVVADQYGLNPWTKEIYAYPDKGGIVPVVGVDGWSRIINENPQLDGIDFRFSEATVDHKGIKCHEWVECVIFRKDRTHPTVAREYFCEVVRKLNYPTPWDTHPNRMHRHKALIQCARIAFGFVGIFDQDEAERIIEKDVTPQKRSGGSVAKYDWEDLTEQQQSQLRADAATFSAYMAEGHMEQANVIHDSIQAEGIEMLNGFWSLVPSDQRKAFKKYRHDAKREVMISSLKSGAAQPEVIEGE